MNENLKSQLLWMQRGELTEHYVYMKLASREKSPANREVLRQIAADERRHYEFWGQWTQAQPPRRRLAGWLFVMMGRLAGLTFAIRMMERGERNAQAAYAAIAREIPEASQILQEEDQHEHQLMAMIDEERLRYVGSVVLGLNDALVELLGALAGLTLALGNTRLIAMIGLITGIAASLSMAASEYLSTKADGLQGKSPLKASIYTGITYVCTVMVLVSPYLLIDSPLAALCVAIGCVLAIIGLFTFYVSVARELPFWRRFAEMAGLCLAVGAVSFAIGYFLRLAIGVEV